MIDIHSHILFGVDDGPTTIRASMRIIKQAAAEGVHTIVATPHILDEPKATTLQDINNAFDKLRQQSCADGVQIEILRGAELFMFPDCALIVKANPQLTINGQGKYVLVELPHHEIPPYTDQVFFDFQRQGITPILAHPERNIEIATNPNWLFGFIQRGILAHLNAGSLLGKHGRMARSAAKTLLSHDLVQMIASDVHSVAHSPYALLPAVNAAARIVGSRKAREMVEVAPDQVIRGESVKVDQPKPVKKSLFRRIVG